LVSHFVLYPRVAFRNDSKRARARFFYFFSRGLYSPPPPLFLRATVSLAFLIIGTECRCRPSSHFLSSSDPRLTRGHHSTIDRVSSCFLPPAPREKEGGGGETLMFCFSNDVIPQTTFIYSRRDWLM
jgi:hypothetical protein